MNPVPIVTRVGMAVLALIAVAANVLLAGTRARAADEYVQYYTVVSASENLGAISQRLLGDARRSTEIFNLNAGRRQPDGAALADGNKLHAGWYLVLPWDAVGTGVRYGVLPSRAATPTGSGKKSDGKQAAPVKGGKSSSAPGPAASRSPDPVDPLAKRAGVLPKSRPSGPAPGKKCLAPTANSKGGKWAMPRLAVEQAWKHSRGAGQMIAIVDSGVDGGSVQLSGRVTIGADVVTDAGRGDIDCLGTGTAMAGLVAANPMGDLSFGGVAPEAVVMPVRVVIDGKAVDATGQATAIKVAASAGATVLALGSHVDVTDAAVAEALRMAVERNVVVVACAPVAAKAVTVPDGVILVGGVAKNNKLAAKYALAAIDVVAPGVDIDSIGANGAVSFVRSGTEYAVALTAGTVALVRSSHPELTVGQVAHRVAATADERGGSNGKGMIDPVAAVTEKVPGESAPAAKLAAADRVVSAGNGQRIAFLFTVLAGIGLSALLVFRFRRRMRLTAIEGSDELDQDWPAGPAQEETGATVSTGSGSS